MSRSTRRIASVDSTKENTPSVPTTPVKSKSTRRSSNAPLASNTKNTPAEDDMDEDAEGSAEEQEEDEAQEDTPKARKRARANTAGEATSPILTQNNESDSADQRTTTRAGVKTLDRDPTDGYVPGSIVRVKLQNFVTYDDVEFRCGPHLNMILGPNGTGKSSIACALCLGLNFPPAVLGRATDISAFVKDQCKEGFIEIELKGKPGPRGAPSKNLVVRRNLFAGKKTSSFTLNGTPCTGKEINTKIAELNIQVGNLCSFLPQDKVAEFARMNQMQLLRETQRAAGDDRLTEWHNTLIESGKEQRDLTEKLTADRDQLKTAEERNQALERDVERFQQRMALEKEIAVFELALPFVQYTVARKEFYKLKDVQRKKHERANRLKARQGPAESLKKELENEVRALSRRREAAQKKTKDKLSLMGETFSRAQGFDKEAESYYSKLQTLKQDEKDRQKAVVSLKEKIAKLRRELENPPDVSDAQEVVEAMRKNQAEGAGTKRRHEEFRSRQQQIIDEIAEANQQINDATKEMRQLENVAHQKLANLRKWDRDAADTVEWLRKNQSKFKMEVLEPPCLTVRPRDMRFADQIDACFNASQMKTFVCQCAEDSKTLNWYINDSTEALGRKAGITVWFRPRNNVAPPPMSREELVQLGFDTYAIDQVEFPEGLLWFLESAVQLHRTAIALDVRRVDTKRAMEAVSSPQTGGSGNYIVGKVMNQVQRSNYGQRLPTNTTKDIPQSKNFSGQTVDQTQKRAIDVKIKEARAFIAEKEAQHQALSAEERDINKEYEVYQKKQDALVKRKEEIAKAKRQITKLTETIRSMEVQLREKQNAPGIEAEQKRLQGQLLKVGEKRAKAAKMLIEYIRQAMEAQEETTTHALQWVQMKTNQKALETLIHEKAEKYSAALAEFKEADEAYKAIKQVTKTLMNKGEDLLAQADPEVKETFLRIQKGLEDKTEEEMQTELDNLKAKLDLYAQNNPGVIEQYERRKGEIENLQKTIAQREKAEVRLQEKIDTAKANWEPKLESLVQSIGRKFSKAFDTIGCAGEIRIARAPEFEKWAIDILVKFRDDERLQLLTGQRQSGGERALTTIMYLMSLTEEARAPFSLVDEINQGMDQRYERAVHNQMVEVTCNPNSCQYFLITPKLLPGLRYDERMKVLCVNNGEWLPEERGIGNMKSLLDRFARHRGGANAA